MLNFQISCFGYTSLFFTTTSEGSLEKVCRSSDISISELFTSLYQNPYLCKQSTIGQAVQADPLIAKVIDNENTCSPRSPAPLFREYDPGPAIPGCLSAEIAQ